MKYLLNGLERHGIGRRAYTESDFYRVCDLEAVDIVWSDKPYPFYFTVPEDNVKGIVLPKRLTGDRLLYAQLHEMGHSLLENGSDTCIAFLGGTPSKAEAEADAIALLAMFPDVAKPPMIWSRFLRKLWDDRLQMFFLYGI